MKSSKITLFWGGGISIEEERDYDFLPKHRESGDNTLLIKVKHA
jgi:hypothetical protein